MMGRSFLLGSANATFVGGDPRSRPRHVGCPRPESNQRTRFRKPLLYPLSYGGGTNHDSVGHGVLRNISELPFSFPRTERGRGMALGRTMIALGVLIVIGSNGIAASASAPGPSPGNFVRRVNNPWFPLIPGTTFVYRGIKDGKTARDLYSVTSATKTIQGVHCTA